MFTKTSRWVARRPGGGHTDRIRRQRPGPVWRLGSHQRRWRDRGRRVSRGKQLVELTKPGYVFSKPAGGWTDSSETAMLTVSDGSEDDAIGSAVAVSRGRGHHSPRCV